MKYSCSLIAVKDIERSKAFYRDTLGQKIVLDVGMNVAFEAGFAIQEDFAELVGLDPASTLYKTHNFEFYFEEDQLENLRDRLLNTPGVQFVHEIKEYPWGQRVFRIYDPDMHIIEFGESMDLVVRRFLDQGLSVEETAGKTMFPIEYVLNCQRQGA
jgi:catechol 2,3-dioxygenase-like lactoylglutathione lyase family enzyme